MTQPLLFQLNAWLRARWHHPASQEAQPPAPSAPPTPVQPLAGLPDQARVEEEPCYDRRFQRQYWRAYRWR